MLLSRMLETRFEGFPEVNINSLLIFSSFAINSLSKSLISIDSGFIAAICIHTSLVRDSISESLLLDEYSIKEIIFPDHYEYKPNDIYEIKALAKNFKAKILTTEKDFVKINPNINDDIKFLEIELDIKDEGNLINYLKLRI